VRMLCLPYLSLELWVATYPLERNANPNLFGPSCLLAVEPHDLSTSLSNVALTDLSPPKSIPILCSACASVLTLCDDAAAYDDSLALVRSLHAPCLTGRALGGYASAVTRYSSLIFSSYYAFWHTIFTTSRCRDTSPHFPIMSDQDRRGQWTFFIVTARVS
jgi:hypothetical protein